MSIHQTDMFHLNNLNNQNGLYPGDYYYVADLGRLYKAESVNVKYLVQGIYFVASEFDRINNIPKITNKQYYCVEKNELWKFDESNTWNFIDGGNTEVQYIDSGFFDGNFLFAQTYVSEVKRADDATITTTMQKINNIVFCSVKIHNPISSTSETLIARVPTYLRPAIDTEVIVNYDVDSNHKMEGFKVMVSSTNNGIQVSNAQDILKLNNMCRFWYTIPSASYRSVT